MTASPNTPDPGTRDPDGLIRRAGLRVDPDQDQHFLVDDRVLDRIPSYLPETADRSHLLEIGGGAGALTDRLLGSLPADGQLTVIERHEGYGSFLETEFADAIADGQLTVVTGDALKVELPPFTASVSNLPYGVSSEIAFRLLPEKQPLVATFQAEFADRMVADPGTSDYGRLSVSAQHYANVEIVERIPREAFEPKPAVESAVVRCTPRYPDYEVDNEAFFLRFVKALFTQRRKTVRNAIRNTGHISGLADPDSVVDVVDAEQLQKRPGDLAPATFAEIATIAAAHGDPSAE